MKKTKIRDAPRTLVIDVGGTHVKFLATGQAEARQVDSSRRMTPEQMVGNVLACTQDWHYDVVALGLPAPVVRGRPVAEPPNLGKGWVDFDFESAFERPLRIINDAAMQALGSYAGGRMLFLGLGTGLGTTMIVEGAIVALELAHLPYKEGKTYEEFLGKQGLRALGKKKWRLAVHDVIALFEAALRPDYVMLGGGNVHQLGELPANVRLGDNANAFAGGFRLWQHEARAAGWISGSQASR